jgi:hypothetical protein
MLAVSAVSSLASGAVGYLGAQNAAAQAENQATAAEQMAAYNAQIAQNNAVAEAGDQSFQASVAQFNAADSAQTRSKALRDQRTQTAQRMAKAEAKGARTGTFDYSFDDVLRSDALLLERQEVEILSGGAQERYQFSKEGELAEMRSKRALETGRTQTGLILAEGRNRASAYRGQASSARIGGYASFLGGVAQGASTGSQAWDAWKNR